MGQLVEIPGRAQGHRCELQFSERETTRELRSSNNVVVCACDSRIRGWHEGNVSFRVRTVRRKVDDVFEGNLIRVSSPDKSDCRTSRFRPKSTCPISAF